jgi:hypothetical protein
MLYGRLTPLPLVFPVLAFTVHTLLLLQQSSVDCCDKIALVFTCGCSAGGKVKQTWTEEQDEELKGLFTQFRELENDNGKQKISRIMYIRYSKLLTWDCLCNIFSSCFRLFSHGFITSGFLVCCMT